MKELLSKISEVKSEIGTLSKNASNPFFKSKYLDLGEILSNLEPILQKHKLLLLQPVLDNSVYTEIHDLESGEIIKSAIPLPNIQDPQKIGSAITYYRRYSLQSLLALQTDDDDGNKASQKEVAKDATAEISKLLESSKDISELETNYKSLSESDKKKFANLTTAIKTRLSKPIK
jgi:hypothetical protein